MHFCLAARILALAVLAGAATPATAVRCYAIVDGSNEVIYQDITPPIDLSDEGAAARDAMRARHQQLITMNSEQCPSIDRGRAGGKGAPATVEEIVAGMRPAVAFGGAASRARESSSDAGGVNLPRITVPRDTGGGMSVGGSLSGMSLR